MRDGESFVNRDSVCDSVARVDNGSCCAPSCEQTHNGLVSEVQLRHLVLFEKSLNEFFTNLVIVVWGLSDKEFVVLGCSSQVIVVQMRKDLTNSVHVFDKALFYGMFNGKDVLL